MRIVIGADHAGFDLKTPIVEHLRSLGHTLLDVGTHNHDPVDYPDLAREVAVAILQGKADLGIMLCGSGVGGAIAANKFPGIRAGLCHDTYSAHQGREDDDVNVLCLGARVVGRSLALEIVQAFLGARFSGLPRHRQRVEKIEGIERHYCKVPVSSHAPSK
ncbi:MAG TPA: ribose 5-phosphate isomerase B [Terriglobia bacterium]|jgi:ribose 5-phosphate isomerase B